MSFYIYLELWVSAKKNFLEAEKIASVWWNLYPEFVFSWRKHCTYHNPPVLFHGFTFNTPQIDLKWMLGWRKLGAAIFSPDATDCELFGIFNNSVKSVQAYISCVPLVDGIFESLSWMKLPNWLEADPGLKEVGCRIVSYCLRSLNTAQTSKK